MNTVQESVITIFVPGAPDLPGLSFRGYRDETDFEKMVAVIQGCKQVDQLERSDTAQDIARDYRHAPNFDITKDMLFVEMNGEVIGYYRVIWFLEDAGDAIYTHFGFLLPEWRGRGIGRAVLAYLQAHIRAIAATHSPEQTMFYQSDADETERDTTALLLSAGYLPARHFYTMVRPDLENIPDLVLPPGYEIRPVTDQQLPAILAASSEAFQDHWGYSSANDPTLEALMEDPDFDPGLWRVAWQGDQVAGMVLSYITRAENMEYQRLRGYTESICVRRPYRKQGLAHALIAASLQALRERGMQEAALHVDTENLSGALRLYESLGFQPVERHTAYRKPLEMVWPNLRII
ncbi:MAG TPA: GNAT family N-acetyltransferase [Anaerolineales bacterium]|nr:GNAT family N-acetyltransferase [Anaerolineales bacterium]